MKIYNTDFARKNSEKSKELQGYVEIAFDDAFTDLSYFTTHTDTPTLNPVNTVYSSVIKGGISGVSQRIDPDKGSATIGSLIIKLSDVNSAITTLFNTKLDIGRGLRGKRVRNYIGFKGLALNKFELDNTQIVDSVLFDNGGYTLKLADIQREERQEIFDLRSTTLSRSIDAVQLLIPVYDIGIELLEHGSSYSDAPNSTVLYIKIEKEIIRCTGTTTDAVVGLSYVVDTNGRGVLNTRASEHIIDIALQDNSRKTKVTEHVYIEMPVPKLIFAILTGDLEGQPGKRLQSNWTLNINPIYVRLNDFTGIGADIWDTTNDNDGRICFFNGEQKQDGKKFIETQLNMMMATYNPIYADGALGLKRITSILSGAAVVGELNESNVISYGPVIHDERAVRNSFEINWSYNQQTKKPLRKTQLTDVNSIIVHKKGRKLTLNLRGLNGGRHTEETLITLLNSIYDRYSAPPILIEVTCLHSLRKYEVGDVLGVNLKNARDFTGALAPLNKPFEVQRKKENTNGSVTYSLFASSQVAGGLPLGNATSVLNDTFYSLLGIELKSYIDTNFPGSFTIVGNVGHITGNITLPGSTPAIIYYYDNPLQIDALAIVSVTNNVLIQTRGHIQVNGLINGIGLGIPATAGEGSYFLGEQPSGTPGAIGNTWAWGGQHIHDHRYIASGVNIGNPFMHQFDSVQALGTYGSLPYFNIVYNPSLNTLVGYPLDVRGSSGGKGGNLTFHRVDNGGLGVISAGGAGGAGGAGLITISRGFTFGVAGSIDLSGNPGAVGTTGTYNGITHYSGAGGGGSGGGFLCLLDGDLVPTPDITKIKTVHGSSLAAGSLFWDTGGEFNNAANGGENGSYNPFHRGYQSDQGSLAYFRIQRLQKGSEPIADVPEETVIAPTALILSSGDADLLKTTDGTIISRIKADWESGPSIDQNLGGYELEYKFSFESNWISASNTINLEITFGYISPAQDGLNYDVRLRAINKFGVPSDWHTTFNYTVLGKTTPPPNCDTFLVQRQADGTRTFDGGLFEINRPTDLAGYEIRTGLGTGLSWEQMVPLHSGLITQFPFETNQLAAGNYSAGLKAVDTSLNKSINALIITSNLGDPRINNAITTVDFFANKFPGLKTNCWVDKISGELIATGTTPWSAIATWSAFTRWAITWNSTFIYEHTVIDIGVVTKFTPLVTVTSNATTIVVEESHSDDNVTFTPYSTAGPEISGRYIIIKITVTNVSELPKITQALVIIDANIVEEYIEDTNTSLLTGSNRIAIGDIRLPIIKTYSQIKNVQIALQNVTAGWSWVLIDKDITGGPRIKIYNASNVLSDATIDAFISGA